MLPDAELFEETDARRAVGIDALIELKRHHWRRGFDERHLEGRPAQRNCQSRTRKPATHHDEVEVH